VASATFDPTDEHRHDLDILWGGEHDLDTVKRVGTRDDLARADRPRSSQVADVVEGLDVTQVDAHAELGLHAGSVTSGEPAVQMAQQDTTPSRERQPVVCADVG
jgi:hypothetical protein